MSAGHFIFSISIFVKAHKLIIRCNIFDSRLPACSIMNPVVENRFEKAKELATRAEAY